MRHYRLLRRIRLYTVFALAVCLISDFSSAQDKPMLYFFTSDGCAPCKLVAPSIAELKSEGFPVTVINASQRRDWVESLKVSSTPAVYLLRGNRVLNYHFGVMRKSEMRAWLDAAGVRPQSRTPSRVTTLSLIHI